ncbi:hypothetical protein ASG84_11310 [Rhodococcus sp. Leaf278]|uniref:PucR family transcriptional regulator n=1 Tax=Rhodococcus sp. Leaf278 TaxID=1736319 RepID=UPI00070ABD90|nr:helix-turn-helix domain-containing protein [Rhodococcus sp. Leaf278]KQU45880.1 hypothetical protein ASG84_11310 [Rhodococcus sp. Leaf278]
MTQAEGDRVRDRERDTAARIAALVEPGDIEIDAIAADLTELYRTSIPVYDLVARDEIERNTRAVLDIVLRQVLGGDAPTVDPAELTELVRRWSVQQIPLELVAHSIQVGARRLSTIIRARAELQGISSDVVDDVQDMMWHWATSYSAVVNAVMQENAVSLAAHRSSFMRRLLDGVHTPAALPALLAEHRIVADHRYYVACADFDDPRVTSDVVATLRLRAATREIPVFDAVVDSYFVALLPMKPDIPDVEAVIAVGSAELPSDAAASYQQARRTLDVATRFGRMGIVNLAHLGALPLLCIDDGFMATLADIHLAPLRERGDAGREIIETVAQFLHHNRRVDETAAALFLHRNTVRNRVSKFTALTGLDLDITDDLVLTWWLLGRR